MLCTGLDARPVHVSPTKRSTALATPNYSYEKRQRELAKKRKNEEKKQKKQVREPGDTGPDDEPSADNGDNTAPPAPAVS